MQQDGKGGMQPQRLDKIEVVGEPVSSVRRNFARPQMNTWKSIRALWDVEEMP